ncbi:unnamed protein product [Dracunculus medinensis]|uniref:Dynactin subunit 3 n=1 Tax=Dracunculus medinensis TaxID=318479 RepID=A0A0N4URP0_DRAME|nr:unnamed protein product [Dracunculus medinensis]
MESLVERLTAVEGRLGLPPITKSNQNLSRKLSSLQKRLSDNGYGFILKIPPKQIQKVYNFSNKLDECITRDEKERAIEFGYDRMMEFIRLISEFQKGSEVVLNSVQLATVTDHKPALEVAENELKETANDVSALCSEILELKQNFIRILNELQLQVKDWEIAIEELEKLQNQNQME